MKRLVLLVCLVLFTAVVQPVRGQAMEDRFYILPVQRVGKYRGPMYLKWRFNPDGLNAPWWMVHYGRLDIASVAVQAEITDHDWLAVQDGVFALPANLDVNPSPAELSAFEARLEGAYVPADWLRPNMTWRECMRTVAGMMLFMQRLCSVLKSDPIELGWQLNDQFRNLLPEEQNAIREAFTTVGYDDSVIRANWTLRVLLKNAADQLGERTILFNFVEL